MPKWQESLLSYDLVQPWCTLQSLIYVYIAMAVSAVKQTVYMAKTQ